MISIKKLYKYQQKEHATALVERGVIRVGTLHSYRDTELGSAIGDLGEGKSETTHHFDKPVNIGNPENRSWVVDKIFDVAPGANVTLEGLSLVVPEESPDFFIYCLSHRYSSAAMRAFNADACVEILQPQRFISALVGHLRDRGLVSDSLFAPCDYSGRARDHQMKRVHPGLLKDRSYEYQMEVRLLMNPQAGIVADPIIVTIPELSNYCTMRN